MERAISPDERRLVSDADLSKFVLTNVSKDRCPRDRNPNPERALGARE